MPFEFFDPTQDIYIRYSRLPHWEQAGTTYFITWRTVDSIPQAVLNRWRVERAIWLRQHHIDPSDVAWRQQLRALPPSVRHDYHCRFTSPWMDCLDECHGACVLRRPDLSAIVHDNLRHLDDEKYLIAGFVVMPNHVHVLVQLPDEGQLAAQGKAWKHYTAGRINKAIGRSGRFWQRESFDHLVRSEVQFNYLLEYIARNPEKARLTESEYRLYQRPM